MGAYDRKLEWAPPWTVHGGEGLVKADGVGVPYLRTYCCTQRGNGDQAIVVAFTVDQVLAMIRQDPAACERLLHHADLARGAAALGREAQAIAKQAKAAAA